MVNIAEEIANFVAKTKFDDIPLNILSYMKERILDIIGACIAGSRDWKYSAEIVKSFKELDMGRTSTIIGRRELLSCPFAAMVNTAFGHAMELDDGHKNAGVHAGTVIVPTALTIGEVLHSSGKDVLTAIILGYEFTYRIARSINPAQIRKGFHPSATCGTFGATVVTAKLLGLNEKQISSALGLSGLQTAGLMEATISGQASKSVMVGHAAFAGIISAWLAKRSIVGPSSIFEGKYGIFNTMSEKVNQENILADLGTRFEILDTYVKLYPVCRHIHPVIESIIYLRKEYGFSEIDLLKVIVSTYEIAIELTGSIYEPKDSAEARFSLPFTTAITLREGRVGLEHLKTKFLDDKGIKEISRLVEVRLDEEINNVFPKKRGARVEIYLKNGAKFKKTTYILKGSPELPVGPDIIYKKFLDCASGILSRKITSQIITSVEKFEDLKDVGDFIRLIRPN